MSECYPFKSDQTLMSHENVTIWNEESPDKQNITHYVSTEIAGNISECFETSDATEYLSVLETTNDISLNDFHNITLENPKIFQEGVAQLFDTADQTVLDEVGKSTEEDGNQIVVFTVEGSDDLYGIQMIQNEEGNMEKVQFKFRANENGELEAIPESVQLLTTEEEEEAQHQQQQQKVSEFSVTQEENSQDNGETFLHEYILPETVETATVDEIANQIDHMEFISQEPEEEQEETLQDGEETEEEHNVDVKPDRNIKQELLIDEESDQIEAYTNQLQLQDEANYSQFTQPVIKMDHHDSDEEAEEYLDEEYLPQNEEEHQLAEEAENEEEYEEIYIESDFTEDQQNSEQNPQPEEEYQYEMLCNTNQTPQDDDETEDFEIIDGMPVTGDTENNAELHEPISEIHEEDNVNVLKQYASKTNVEEEVQKKVNNFKPLFCYVVKNQEKENVVQNPVYINKPAKPNPRSILKTALISEQEKQQQAVKEEKYMKRFAKSKDAIQARMFHNFITQTTIPQAPVRSERLPRKQKIKPVNERQDEEIIVQEVMVSSNGTMQAIVNGSRGVKHAPISHTVELSDTDDDDVQNQDEIIEILNSDEEDDIRKQGNELEVINTPEKRKRGRPSKKLEDDSDEYKGANAKPCPHCHKAFPSQNSLNTHIQHHNLENSLKTNPNLKCKNCDEVFKSIILKNKHMCHKTFQCVICKDKFASIIKLNEHKRSHAKNKLIRNTSIVKVSPIKYKRASLYHNTAKTQTTQPKTQNSHKCNECSKVCSTISLLNNHMLLHKKFKCVTCSKSFTSRILLDTHVRESCVKIKSPQGKRLSFTIKKYRTPVSLLGKSPRLMNKTRLSLKPNSKLNYSIKLNASTMLNASTSSQKPTGTPSGTKMRVPCEICSKICPSFSELFRHKVIDHGIETPDKSVTMKPRKTLYKPRGVHGGIPANEKLNKAFAALRSKLKDSQDEM